MKVFTIFNTIT